MPANVSYTITVNKMNSSGTAVSANVALSSSTTRVSTQSPYNTIIIKLTTPANESLIKFQARITKATDSWDIDLGKQVLYDTNIASNTTKTYTLAVNTTNFSQGNGIYRVSLYTQSSIDYQWDVEHLFMVTEDNGQTWIQFNPSDASDGMTVSRSSPINEGE